MRAVSAAVCVNLFDMLDTQTATAFINRYSGTPSIDELSFLQTVARSMTEALLHLVFLLITTPRAMVEATVEKNINRA